MSMKYVKLFYDWYDMLRGLPDEDMGKMFRAIMSYAIDGEPQELDGVVKMMFPFFKTNIDRNEEAYEKKLKQCREAARKGGLATQANAKRPLAESSEEQNQEKEKEKDNEQHQDQNQENEKDNDYDYKQEQDRKAFWGDFGMDDTGMNDDVEKINKFIIEKGLDCDGREFYEYYKKRNWEVGGKRIENWKGLLISWAKNRKCDELNVSKRNAENNSSFDTDDFFEAAVRASMNRR